MTSSPQQYVTLVGSGGTPVRLADAKGRPYPTTGDGALVFSENPTITGATLVNPTIEGPTIVADITVATMVDLSLLDSLPTTVVVNGFYEAGDGGGGIFYWDATSVAATVSGIVVAVVGHSTGRYLRLFDGPISVAWTGAKGDGTTDNTALIQVAIDATPSGGTLYLPVGDFYCESSLIRDGASIIISGGGLGSKITFGSSAGLVINATTGTNDFGLGNCTIRSFSGTTNTLVTLSRINSQGFIRNVYFQGGGIHVWYERSVYNVSLIGCTLYAAQIVALNLVPSVASTINANGFLNCFFVGNKRHVELSGVVPAIAFRQCIFQRNSVISGVQTGIYVHGGCWNTIFDGCGFEDVNAVACVEFGSSRYPSFRSGYFSLNAADVIAVDCSGSDGNCIGLAMDQFSITVNNANNPLINLRSFGVRPHLRGVLFAAGTVAKGVAGSVPERDVYLDITYDGTFTVKSDYAGRTSDLTAWWTGSGASTPVSTSAFNLVLTRTGTGTYDATFLTAMDTEIYTVVPSCRYASDISQIRVQPGQTINRVQLAVVDSTGTLVNADEIQINVAGGLN